MIFLMMNKHIYDSLYTVTVSVTYLMIRLKNNEVAIDEIIKSSKNTVHEKYISIKFIKMYRVSNLFLAM